MAMASDTEPLLDTLRAVRVCRRRQAATLALYCTWCPEVMETAIKGFERIVQTLGFGNFADYEVLRVTLTRTFNPTLEIIVLTDRSPQKREADPSGPDYYIVRLPFRGIEDLEIEGFNHQNVIQDLVQTKVDDRWKIHFAGIFGMDCSFSCDEGEVLSIEPTQMKLGQIQVTPTI